MKPREPLPLRQFNAAGIQTFRNYVAAARENPALPPPWDLLLDDQYSLVVSPQIVLEPREFRLRADAAHYFKEVLAPLEEINLLKNAGLWTWLTLYYFDEVAPEVEGRRSLKNDYHYIYEPKASHHYIKHLLFLSWRIISITLTYNRLLLQVPIYVYDAVTDNIMKKLFITRIPCIFEVLDRIYWDDINNRVRTGIVTQPSIKPGDLNHRLPLRIRQLEKTYDLHELSAERLIELLGEEFRPYRQNSF
jgi:hypothetical protein